MNEFNGNPKSTEMVNKPIDINENVKHLFA